MGWVTMVTTSLISLRAGCGPPSQKVFVRINQAVFEVTHNCSCLEQEASVTKRGPGGDACRFPQLHYCLALSTQEKGWAMAQPPWHTRVQMTKPLFLTTSRSHGALTGAL